jgi:hypothetical protein
MSKHVPMDDFGSRRGDESSNQEAQLLKAASQGKVLAESMDFEEMETVMWRKVIKCTKIKYYSFD